MRSLVMSLFSRDLLVNCIRYLQCLNLHEYNIYTAPGLTSILVFIILVIYKNNKKVKIYNEIGIDCIY